MITPRAHRWSDRLAHALHPVTQRFPLLPVGLLAVFSHLAVYAFSDKAWWWLAAVAVLWSGAFVLFRAEVYEGFERAHHDGDDLPKTAAWWRRGWHSVARWVRFASPSSVVLGTSATLVVITLAIKYVSAALFQRECGSMVCGVGVGGTTSIVAGMILLAWILLGYRPGAYGASLQAVASEPRPYLVVALSLERPETLRFYPTADSPETTRAAFSDYFRKLASGAQTDKIESSIAHGWRGIAHQARSGKLRRLYVIVSGKSASAANIGCLRQCRDGYEIAAKEWQNSPGTFDIQIVHVGADMHPIATPLDKFVCTDERSAANAGNELEDFVIIQRILRFIEDDARHHLGRARPWLRDIANDIVIDITGGLKTYSTVAFLYAYGRPILTQYIQTDNKYEVVTYDVNPRPGPHF